MKSQPFTKRADILLPSVSITTTPEVSTTPWSWRVLHLVMALLAPVLLSLLLGCPQKPSLKPHPLGQEVDSKSIDNKLEEILLQIDPYRVQLSTESLYESNYRVETAEVQKFADVQNYVVGIQDDADAFLVTYRERSTSYSGGTPSTPLEKENVIELPPRTAAIQWRGVNNRLLNLSSNFAITLQKQLKLRQQSAIQNGVLLQADERPVIRISHHNLRTEDKVVEAPDAVRSRAGCEGLSSCALRVRQIDFDSALWFSETEYEVVSSQWTVSADTPYLATVVSECVAQMLPINNRDYYVRSCRVLRDFKF